MNYYLAFSYSPIGGKVFGKLLDAFGDVEKIWKLDASEMRSHGIGPKRYVKFNEFRKEFDIESAEVELEKKNILFISQNNNLFPQGLNKLEAIPIGIYVKGDMRAISYTPAIGVVGTRKISSYGRRVTGALVSGLVAHGASIVSGLALGVDAQAHTSCLDAGGVAVVVLGNGVDMALPSENAQLYLRILARGGAVVSEYPPGTPPTKGSFPSRNRIIAALSDSLVVTEAARGSGSLITAGYAKELGKSVYAVPGQVGSYGAGGVHELLKNGALFAERAEDILREKSIGTGTQKDIDELPLGDAEKKVLGKVREQEWDVDELSRSLSITSGQLLVILSSLEIAGYIRQEAGRVSVAE